MLSKFNNYNTLKIRTNQIDNSNIYLRCMNNKQVVKKKVYCFLSKNLFYRYKTNNLAGNHPFI